MIVGLGNPGPEYRETRHNAGFMVVDRLAVRWGGRWSSAPRFFADMAEAEFGGVRWRLVKPVTYMNLSGDSVGPLMAYYKVPLERLLVVVDDADLPLGTIRMRPEGSAGGHHGLESILRHVGSPGFARQRVGIHRPEDGRGVARRDIAGHVLGKFEKSEIETLEKVLVTAVAQVEAWVRDGIGKAMNLYNGPVR